MIRKLWLIATVLTLSVVVTRAQEVTPKAEIFGTYSYFRVGQSPGYDASNLNKGLGVAGVFNLNRWLGAVIDTGHHWGHQPLTFTTADGITEAKTTIHTLMAGPRFTYRTEKVTPFANLLIGGARIYNGYGTTPPAPAPGSPLTPAPGTPGYGTAPGASGYERETNTVFAWGIGGGFDLNVTDRIAYRPIEAQYVMTRADGLSGKGVNNLRLSTGIVVRFGSISK
jgi:hypothetical protein